MIKILTLAEKEKMRYGGKPDSLCIEDRLLMSLEYWREYRTFFHISKNYGLSESQCFRNIRWIEDVLIKDGTFSLPGKKELLNPDIEVILIDATENVVERPKKNRENIIQVRKRNIL